MAMTKEQLEYQLERIDNVLKNSSISEDDKTMLEQQKVQLKERLDAMLPKEEVKQEEPVEIVEQVEVKEPVIEDTQEEQKTYEQKVDEFINNVKVEVDAPEVNENGDVSYLSELKHNVKNYQEQMQEQVESISTAIEAQEIIISLIEKELEVTEAGKIAEALKDDVKTRKNIVTDAHKAIAAYSEKLKLYDDIMEFIDTDYDKLVLIDKYFNAPLQLQETLDFFNNIK